MAYDTVGALGGMFAPAYIHGNAQSEAAVADWNRRNHVVTNDVIEQSRKNGIVDQNALRAAAQGGPYDVNAGRDAIAAAVVQQPAAFQLKYLPNGQLDTSDPGNIAYYNFKMGSGPMPTGASAPAAQQPAAQQPAVQQPVAQQPAYQPPAQDPYNSYAYGGSA